ncbi:MULTISPECIES: chaplin [unclassified Streptomyces]|uniref:Chaplin n=2 Tax=Streptomyces TaxID=1883 RepID=A0ABD5EVK6_9ACTN|nr:MULTISPECIES: chaplin [unclassified Streptomyces]MDT0438766.1 chaplin [Streptomyces sp. DSM 41981]
MRSLATTAALAGALTLLGATAAQADPDPTVGTAVGSPGVLSGDVIQVPIHIPVNLCGNSIDVVGLLNPAVGNACSNG